MKIIKDGKPPENKIHRTNCRNCRTRFEFAAREAKYISDQRDGDFLQIACPTCGVRVTVTP